MKTKTLLLMLVLATCVGLSSCSENKIAKDNIKQYITSIESGKPYYTIYL